MARDFWVVYSHLVALSISYEHNNENPHYALKKYWRKAMLGRKNLGEGEMGVVTFKWGNSLDFAFSASAFSRFETWLAGVFRRLLLIEVIKWRIRFCFY